MQNAIGKTFAGKFDDSADARHQSNACGRDLHGCNAAFDQRVTIGKEIETVEGTDLRRQRSFFRLVSTKAGLRQDQTGNQDLRAKVMLFRVAGNRNCIARAEVGDDSIDDNHGSIFNWFIVAGPDLVGKVDIRLSLLCEGFGKGRTDRNGKQQAEDQTVWNKFHDVKVSQSRMCSRRLLAGASRSSRHMNCGETPQPQKPYSVSPLSKSFSCSSFSFS